MEIANGAKQQVGPDISRSGKYPEAEGYFARGAEALQKERNSLEFTGSLGERIRPRITIDDFTEVLTPKQVEDASRNGTPLKDFVASREPETALETLIPTSQSAEQIVEQTAVILCVAQDFSSQKSRLKACQNLS